MAKVYPQRNISERNDPAEVHLQQVFCQQKNLAEAHLKIDPASLRNDPAEVQPQPVLTMRKDLAKVQLQPVLTMRKD